MERPWEAERRVDAELARRLIREQIPEVPADRVELLGEGWDNVVYRVDGEWAFRFPRRQLGADLLEGEIRALRALAGRLPLPVPDPVYAGRPTEEYPWPFAGCRYLPGRPACRAGLGDEARHAAAEPLGRFLAALHAVPAAGELAGLPGDTLGRLDPAKRVPQARERLQELAALGLIAGAVPWLPLLEDLPAGPRPCCLVHGDLYACHLLVTSSAGDSCQRSPRVRGVRGGGGLCGVIDWGDVHLGDPAADLMIAYTFLPAPARPAFWAAYGPADEETRRLARFRAVYHTATVALYAHGTGDQALLADSIAALGRGNGQWDNGTMAGATGIDPLPH